MRIVYTDHAEDQILKRNLEKIWVEETIKYPDKTIRKGNKFCTRKKLNGLSIEVIYVKENYIKIVTVYFIK